MDQVVNPSCAALAQVEEAIGRESSMEIYLAQLGAREGRKSLALALAGLWECQFREHMWKSAAVIDKGTDLEKIWMRDFPYLERRFFKMRQIQLSVFPEYRILQTLIVVANAARHGNGGSSQKLYDDYSNYYSHTKPRAGYYSYFLHGGTRDNDVRYIDIKHAHLVEFGEAIISFWKNVSENSKVAEQKRIANQRS